nr:D-hexose-6-phosphate mutarotase [Actinomyces sp.]
MSTSDDTRGASALHLPRTAALGPGRGGQQRLLVDAPAGSAEIYLQGATLTSWRPQGGKEVLFTSRDAVFDGERGIRGGVPLCSPWFGSGPDGDRAVKHGWVRTRAWSLRSVESTGDGGVRALLSLEGDGLVFLYEVVVGEELSMILSVRNSGPAEQVVEAALHHYLAVADVTAVSIEGLEGQTYLDTIVGGQHRQDGPLLLSGLTDRIYSASKPVHVIDPAMGRRVVVDGVNAPEVVVWNPWSQGVRAFNDLAAQEWPTFVCVEAARIRQDAAVLAAGESVSMGARIRVEDL